MPRAAYRERARVDGVTIEHEIKLTAPDAAALERVLADEEVRGLSRPGSTRAGRRFLATYYDTDDRRLYRRRWSFRIRREGETWKAALKWGGALVDGVSRRQELEARLDGPVDDPGALPEGELKRRLLEAVAPGTRLVPSVIVDMERSQLELALEGGTLAELVTDRGRIEAGGRSAVLCEVEIEHLSGRFEPLAELGRRLASRYRLVPSTLSKHEIGLRLLDPGHLPE